MRTEFRLILLWVTLFVSSFLGSPSIAAGRTEYLLRNETFCSSNKEICVKGSLSYTHGTGTVKLHGRVKSVKGPGLLLVSLTGTDKFGRTRFFDLEVAIRGKRTEIVDYERFTGARDVESWELSEVIYYLEVDDDDR